jgi:hypothetical protein
MSDGTPSDAPQCPTQAADGSLTRSTDVTCYIVSTSASDGRVSDAPMHTCIVCYNS